MIASTTQTDSTMLPQLNTSRGSFDCQMGRRTLRYRKKLIQRPVMFALLNGLVAVCVLFVGLIIRQIGEGLQGQGTNGVLVLSESTTSDSFFTTEEPATTIVFEELVAEEPKRYTEEEVRLVAQTLYGEARGCSRAEQRLVVWCICNRVDEGSWGNSIEDVVKYPHQFVGYVATNPVWPELEAVAREVLEEWNGGNEADILESYAKTSKYLYFRGDDKHNWYREEW